MATTKQMAVPTNTNDNTYPQETVEAMGETSQEKTTVFNTDAEAVHAAPIKPLSLKRALLDTSTTNFDQSGLADFLGKPVILYSAELSATDSVATPLWSQHLPHDVLNAIPMYKDKLRGFAGFRATINIRIVVNASRFQQGRYILNFVHTAGTDPLTQPGGYVVAAHNATLTARTQLPKVEIDLNCVTEATISLPYVSCLNYIPLSSVTGVSGWGSLGELRLYPYVPLMATSGPTTCGFTVWVSFTECEFIGPAAPQSGRMGKMKATTPTEGEQKSAKIGPLGSTLVKVSKALNYFGDVPLISAYTAPSQWIIDKITGAVNVFGWSKPIELQPTHRMVRDTLPYFSQVDSATAAEPLYAVSKNQVGVMPGFSGTDIDEMDFSYLKTVPAWDATINWTTSQASGYLLTDYPVAALTRLKSRIVASNQILDYKPYEFIAYHFAYYRGSLTYTFKFVKTEFHSGRLAFAFYPCDEYDAVLTAGFAESNYLHREIVDLRECNEVTFNIPFLSSAPWRMTRDGYSPIGHFRVYVVDELRCPDTVSPTVPMIVEISGGKDFEVAVPTTCNLTPVYGLTPEMAPIGKMVATGVTTTANSCAIAEGELGGSSVKRNATINEEACVGESITSFRTLMKSANMLKYFGRTGGFVSTGSAINATNKYLNLQPFAAPVFLLRGDGTTWEFGKTSADLLSRLSSIYAMARGGMRMHIIPLSPSNLTQLPPITLLQMARTGNQPYNVDGIMKADPFTAYGEDMNRDVGGCMTIAHNTTNNHSFEFQVAQYGRLHSRSTAESLVSATTLSYGSKQSRSLTPLIATTTAFASDLAPGTAGVPLIGRSAADDTNFGVFKSIPPMSENIGLTLSTYPYQQTA